MTFNPSIPAAGTRIDQTFGLITDNFSQLNLIFGAPEAEPAPGSFQGDHVSWNNSDVNKRGKHIHSRYIEQTSITSTAADECSLYSKEDPNLPNETVMFLRGESDGFEYQLTKAIEAENTKFATAVTSAATGSGWTFLPGGLIMFYGVKKSPGLSGGTVTYPFAFPSGGIAYSIQITGQGTDNAAPFINPFFKIQTSSAGSFTYFSGPSGSANSFLHWIAIGK